MSIVNPNNYTVNNTPGVGGFNMTDRIDNLMDLAMLIMQDRTKILNGQMEVQLGEMEDKNAFLKELSDALAALRANRPTDGNEVKEYPSFQDRTGKWVNVHTFFVQNGIPIDTAGGDTKGIQTEWDAAITNGKGALDSINSESQLDMVRLNGTNKKAELAVEWMVGFLEQNHQLAKKIANSAA